MRLLIRVLVKLVTCLVGGAVAGLAICFVRGVADDPWSRVEFSLFSWIGVYIGICWSIEHNRARNSFMCWTLISTALTWGLAYFLPRKYVELPFGGYASGYNEAPLALAIVGWFVGIVRAISYTGVFRSK